MSDHFDPARALALVALAADDPERQVAYAHAHGCAACRALLREGEQMLHMLDASFALPAVDPALATRLRRRRLRPRALLLANWLLSLLLALLPSERLGAAAARAGLDCALSESAFALLPLALGLWLTRAGRVRLQASTFALGSAVGALLGQLWLRGHCPIHGAALHAFVFHFLGVIALSILGGWLGQRWTTVTSSA